MKKVRGVLRKGVVFAVNSASVTLSFALHLLITLAVANMMLTLFGMYIYHNEIGITLMVVEIINWL
jgi:hypothetical protein